MMQKIEIPYSPQPKQAVFHSSPANEILYGGAAGPGKSMALRHEGLIWCMRISRLQAYLFRRIGPELEKNHIIPSLHEFPQQIGKYKDQKHRWEFTNGSMLHFCHCQYEKDVFQYQGAEIHLLLIDELTTFTEFMYDYLRARCRCTLDIPDKYRHKIPGIACGSNPGGVGHHFVKTRWVDQTKKGSRMFRASEKEGGMLRSYIPGLLHDNMILMKTDPAYIHRLDALPEPYRTAYKEGDWDIFLGQAFAFRYDKHVIEPIPVPEFAPLYMTFDWGFGKPYSVGFWWVDADNRLYRFSEIYGCVKGQNDTGLRQSDEEIAEIIISHEKMIGIDGREIDRIISPDCFSKKPDYKGGGQGPSTAETFAKKGLKCRPGDPNRKLKIRQFHQRLRLYDDMPPMLQVYDTCVDFIRTIPELQADPNNPEDVDTTLEDHPYDEAALMFMARPHGITHEREKEIFEAKKKKEARSKLTGASAAAWIELDKIREQIDNQWRGITDEYQ